MLKTSSQNKIKPACIKSDAKYIHEENPDLGGCFTRSKDVINIISVSLGATVTL
jgi:hypothetical protein